MIIEVVNLLGTGRNWGRKREWLIGKARVRHMVKAYHDGRATRGGIMALTDFPLPNPTYLFLSEDQSRRVLKRKGDVPGRAPDGRAYLAKRKKYSGEEEKSIDEGEPVRALIERSTLRKRLVTRMV